MLHINSIQTVLISRFIINLRRSSTHSSVASRISHFSAVDFNVSASAGAVANEGQIDEMGGAVHRGFAQYSPESAREDGGGASRPDPEENDLTTTAGSRAVRSHLAVPA